MTDKYKKSIELRQQINTKIDELFQIPRAAVGFWESLKLFKDEQATSDTMRAEVVPLLDSFYGPKIPPEEIKMPEKGYIGKSTIQAFADGQRSDISISGDST
jgi:hypothetical protein